MVNMADLEIKPFPRPPPSTHSFRLTGSIDYQAFTKDILHSQLVLNPPSSLDDLLSCYNSTLSDLLDIHAPLITKHSSHTSNPWFTSYLQALKPSAGTLSTPTRAPLTQLLEQKPSLPSNLSPIDTIN